jgi:hypothetical protein
MSSIPNGQKADGESSPREVQKANRPWEEIAEELTKEQRSERVIALSRELIDALAASRNIAEEPDQQRKKDSQSQGSVPNLRAAH